MTAIPSTSNQSLDLTPEPDLHPLYPTPSYITQLLDSQFGLTPSQKAELVAHCLNRACVFADLSLLQYLLADPHAQIHIDLGARDEDGLCLVSLAIQGFGADLDRDVEREECVRLLISQGADIAADQAGWTPLHYAAMLAPPTLISYLMTHGCSPFAPTRRNLTALDIVTAHSIMPGREDVALLLEESMRGEGWQGGRMEQRRRLVEQNLKRKGKQQEVRTKIGKVLEVDRKWWGSVSDSSDSESDSETDDEAEYEDVYTPPPDYSSMLVFAPPSLPQIFDSLIINFQPTIRNATPANTLYMLARFACLTCDHTWLEDLIIGATDAIEETFFNRPEDVTCLIFWLYNSTLWLHLLQCDNSINEACEMLGSFELIEEVINSVFVFIIRFAERRIDQLLDNSILDYIPLSSEYESVQFESEWSFLRPFTGKRRVQPNNSSSAPKTPSSPPSPGRPLSPSNSQSTIASSVSRGKFSSLKQSFARSKGPTTPLSSLFQDTPAPPSTAELISFLTALHTLLILCDINPALTTQLWSQVMYWTSCEIFNRVITRKKYLCRSRSVQISINLNALEEWVEEMGLPFGIHSHFSPVKDLLSWLQCLSSITEFPDLVATIQSMKSLNPLQVLISFIHQVKVIRAIFCEMRRAVRDYKYEVNEGRMTDECIQYLTQLQKDWERHRVKLGVEALRKEIVERDRDREGSVSSYMNDSSPPLKSGAISISSEISGGQHSIDLLFEKTLDKAAWEPIKPPQVLGELLDSRYMLPLLLPSDPRLLSAVPMRKAFFEETHPEKKMNLPMTPGSRSSSRASTRTRDIPFWKSKNKKIRQFGIGTLEWVDGVRSASRWGRPVDPDYDPGDDLKQPPSPSSEGSEEGDATIRINTHITPFTRKPSVKSRGRLSMGEITPVDFLQPNHRI